MSKTTQALAVPSVSSQTAGVPEVLAPFSRGLKAGGTINSIIPQSLEDVYRLSKCIAESGLAPQGMRSPEQVTVAIMTGLEIGLPPMFAIQKIAVINGRPSIWGDAVPAILWSRGFKLREWSDGTGDALTAHCEVVRPDGIVIDRTFSVAQAKKANLWSKPGPWAQYPDRMLQMRARGLACRDGAPDALSGLYLAEEIQETDAPPRRSSNSAKKDGTDKRFNMIRSAIVAATGQREVLEALRAEYDADFETMPARWVEILNNEYEDAIDSCRDVTE
jgi:hypothetical protein